MRASISRASNGRAMTSSAPASRKWIRSSTSWVALTHMTGIADRAGVARISRQMSTADRGPLAISMMTSCWSAALAKASSGSSVVVTV